MDFVPGHEISPLREALRQESQGHQFFLPGPVLCLAFAQLTYRTSLRDTETCLRALGGKLYHLGIRGRVSRSALADASRAFRESQTRANETHDRAHRRRLGTDPDPSGARPASLRLLLFS